MKIYAVTFEFVISETDHHLDSDVGIPHSETYIEVDRFRAYTLYWSVSDSRCKYITEYDIGLGYNEIIAEDYNYEYGGGISMRGLAIEKLKNETKEHADNPWVSYIAESLTGRLVLYDDTELIKGILKESKTILGCLEKLEEAVRENRAGNNSVMLTPTQSFDVIVNYYKCAEPELVVNDVEDEAITTEVEAIDVEACDVERFTRNAWYEKSTGEIIAFKTGDVKPDNLATLKRSSKKAYKAYVEQDDFIFDISDEG